MLRVTAMTKYQAFRWLWRFDSEARLFWLKCFLLGHDLKEDVIINLSDFGVVKRVDFYQLKRLQLQLSNQLEF
jgi:hypothetical protein